MYKDFGFKKGYWKRVRGFIVNYLEGQVSLDLLVKTISEEPRARGEVLWDIFTSIRSLSLNSNQTQLLEDIEERCIRSGFMPPF